MFIYSISCSNTILKYRKSKIMEREKKKETTRKDFVFNGQAVQKKGTFSNFCCCFFLEQ